MEHRIQPQEQGIRGEPNQNYVYLVQELHYHTTNQPT